MSFDLKILKWGLMESMSNTAEPYSLIQKGMDAKNILAHMAEHGVQFLRLQFTDIAGTNKNVEVPASQFEKTNGLWSRPVEP